MKINCTGDGVISYPMHRHKDYEIMLYLEGSGYMRTTHKDFPFSPGTIIIVPPGIAHGSVSERGFKNISVSHNFGNLFHFSNVIVLSDNEKNEGRNLAGMMYDNRHRDGEFLSGLCNAYVQFIMQYINTGDAMASLVNAIASEITERFFESDINLENILAKSGYANDYIRAQFKKITGKTPNGFLTNLRINHAVFLIDIYGRNFTLEQIAYKCGYTDYVYFSKKFKTMMGMSPKKYKKTVL
ncbi:MAG: AraC family transcriptional regulator [Ruminococcaceae bacterium]|nr:AraC family transcriptional regulator [Oscillospiraceae bacterium]